MNTLTTYTTFLRRSIQRLVIALVASLGVFVAIGGAPVFAADPPTITSVVPASAYNTGGDTLTVNGSGYSSGATVTVDGISAPSVVVQSDSLITAVVPVSLYAGDVTVRVTNSDGQYADASFRYLQTSPSVSAVSPRSGPISGGQTVTVTGAGFFSSLVFKSLSAGNDFSCGIAQEFPYCWGNGASGQLGNGGSGTSSVPVAVDTSGVLAGKKIVAISAGTSHVIALDADGKVYAWGNNASGQLGNGGSGTSSVPVAVDTSGVLAGKKIVAISASSTHSLAIDSNGQIYAWGGNVGGQLGDGTRTTRSTPIVVDTSGVLAGKKIVAISATTTTRSLAVDSDGQAYAWGSGANGELGNSSTFSLVPTLVDTSGVLAGKKLVAISGGESHTLAVDADGFVYSWGYNGDGRLGDGTTTNSRSPVAVDTSGALVNKQITAISAGTEHSTAVSSDGQVYTWGSNGSGRLGDGTTTARRSPVVVDTSGVLANKQIVSVSAGAIHTLALDSQGSIYAWGGNTSGRLGNSSTTNSSVPVLTTSYVARQLSINIGELSGLNTTVIDDSKVTFTTPAHNKGSVPLAIQSYTYNQQVAAGQYEYVEPPNIISVTPAQGSIAGGDSVTVNGANFTAGSTVTFGGAEAQIINQTETALTVTTPAQTSGAKDIVVTDSFGQGATLSNGFTYTVPQPTLTSISPSFGPVSGGNTVTLNGANFATSPEFTQVASGTSHACGLTRGGKVYCWGLGGNGQLGRGSAAASNIPVAVDTSGVLAGKKIVAISAGTLHMLALDSDGKVYAWGSAASSQLGNGATSGVATSPVKVTDTGVLLGKKITAIAAGQNYSLALDSDGKVYAWGTNDQGRLGTAGSTTAVPAAVFTNGVLNGKTIVAIAASAHSLALDSNGVVYSWGYNSNGQLGNNTSSSTSNNNAPIIVTTTGTPMAGKKIVSIGVGQYHSLAADDTGAVYGWGANNFRQLGNNTSTAQFTTPIAVTQTGTAMEGKKITALSGAYNFSLAMADDGSVYGWGNNGNGQLGDATTTTRATAVKTVGDLQFTNIATSKFNTQSCGVANSEVYCWGLNGNGQGGDGTSTNHSSPTIIDKTNLSQESAVQTVEFGGNAVPILETTSTRLVVAAPAHAAGLVDVVLKGPQMNDTTATNAYEYKAGPTISALSPSSGSIVGGDIVYISGTNFSQNTTVTVGGSVTDTTYINSTTLSIITPSSINPGQVDVVVSDEFGQTSTANYVYTLPAPGVTSVSPSYAKMTGGATMTITGSGFVAKSGGGSWYEVSVDGQAAQNVEFVNATTLRFTAPAHVPGSVSIVVGGDYSDDVALNNAFTYLPESYAFTNQLRTLMATEPGEFTVQMLNDQGQPVVSTSDTTLSLGSSSNTGFFARALSGSSAGWDYDSVVVPAGQSSATFYYRDSTPGTPTITVEDGLGTQTSQQVTINSRFKMLITGISNPTQVGTPSSVTVQAVDYTGAPQADYRGTVHFTSTDGGATLPADYTFTANDRGRKTFINGVTMGTMGTWDVTVTDTTDAIITGTQEDVVVEAPASGTISQFAFITPAQSFPLDQTSGVMTIQTQDINGTPIPVTQDTTVYLRTSSSTGQFSFDSGSTWSNTPSAVTIPAGSSYRNVLYRDTTAGTYQLKVSQQADNDFGWQVGTQSVSVGVGAPAKLGLDFTNGGSIGDWVPIEVTLTDTSGNRVTSPSDLPVRVAAQNGGEISLAMDGQGAASTVTTFIATGQQSVTVWLRTTNEADITVTATDTRDVDQQDLYYEATAVVRFGEATPTGVLFSGLPAQTTVNTATLLQVSIRDQFGNVVTVPETTTITLTSNSGDGEYSRTANGPWATTRIIEIPAGSSAAPVYFRHKTVNNTVTLQAASEGLDPATGSIQVKAGPYAGKIRFTTDAPISVVAGRMTDFTVELLDAYGNPTVASETVEIGFGTNRPATTTWNGVDAVNPSGPGTGYTLSIAAGQGSTTATYRSTVSGISLLRIYDQARWERSCLQYEYANGPCALWSGWTNSSAVNRELTVEADDPGIYVITSEPQVITKNTSSAAITVQMQDQYGNAASYDASTDAMLSANAQNGTFSLSASGPFTATQVSFGAHQSSAQFYYKSSDVSSQQGDMVIVSGGGLVAATQNIRVIDGVASRALLDTGGLTTASAGDIVPVTLKTQTDDGLDVIVLNDTTFTLSSTAGEFSLTESPFTPITSVLLPNETSQRQLFYRSTVAGPMTLSARSQNIEPIESELAILSSSFYRLGYSKLPADQRVEAAKASDSMVATAYDEYGNVATPSEDEATLVQLSSSKSAGEFAVQVGTWNINETTIAAGNSTTEPFYYRIGTLNSTADALTDPSVLGTQTITAQSTGAESAETELEVVGGLANRIVFTTNQQSLRAGQVSTTIRVQLQNVDGSAAIATEDQTINLSSLNLNDDGDFLAPRGNDVFTLSPGGDPITSVAVAAGHSTAEFYVMPQTAESHRIRVSNAVRNYDGGYLRTVSAAQTLGVTAGTATKFAFTSSEQIIYPNKVSGAIKIAVTDEYGNFTVNEAARTLTLQSSCQTGRFLTSPTGTEVSTVDMGSGASEVVVYYRDTQASAAPCEITVTADNMQSATQTMVVREPVYAFAITSDPQTVIAGQTSAPIVVETRDRFGNTAAVEDPITVEFEATSQDHTITPTERIINNGGSSAQFTFRYNGSVSAPTTFRVIARDVDGVVVSADQEVIVIPGEVTAATYNTPSFTAIAGDYHLLKLQALNAYGKRTVASTDTALALGTSAASGAFYQKVNDEYQQITSATITAGSGEVEVYYRQTQTTRTMAGLNTPATLTATRSGLGGASTQATITAKTLSFSTGNFSAQASAYTPLKVTISSPLTTDLTVSLSTTDTDGAFYQSQNEESRVTSVTIPAGQTQSAQLYYRQTSQTDSSSPTTLTAEPGAAPVSVWRGSVTASVYVNQFSQLVFIAPPSTLKQNQTVSFIVEARDDLGNVVPFSNSQNGYCVYVGSSSGSATITASNNTATGCVDNSGKTAVYVGQYQTRATFTYKDTTTGSATITAANNAGAGGVRQSTNVTIEPATTSKVAFDRTAYNLVRGDEMSLAVRLLSAHDFAVNTVGQTEITLTSDSSTGRFYSQSNDSWVTSLVVTIPANQTEVTGIRYSDATADTSTIIRAATPGLDAAQSTVTIGVGAIEGLVFRNAPTTLERGEQATFTVGFVDGQNNQAPATSNFCLYVTSNGLNGAFTTPSTGGSCSDVTLPGGQFVKAIYVTEGSTEASFTYQTSLLGATTLHASTLPNGGGVMADQAVTVVNGVPVRVGIVPDQSNIERGGVLSGRAVLYNAHDAEVPIDRDITVRLTSDLTDGIFATAGNGPWQGTLDVAILANSSTASFLYQTGTEYLGDVVLSAQTPLENFTSGNATITAVMGEVAQLVFANPELTTTATHPSEAMTLEAQNQYGVATTVEADLQLYPRSSSTTGLFASSSTGPWGMSSAKILAGQSRVTFFYQDETVGTYDLTVRDKLSPQEGEEYLIATQQHHIVEQVFSHFIVTNISSPTRTGVASSAVVFAVDSENYVVAGYDGTVTFSSDDPSAVLPSQSYTFRPEVDRGIHTFNNSIAFKTTGIKSVTVTDQNGNQGSQTNIEVTAGNSAPVRAVSFTNSDTISVDKNTASEVLAMQLRDELGAVTNAPVGGMPLHLTSDSATGQFSIDQTMWSNELTIVVEAGLSFSTTPVYYRDTTGGTHTITVSDWIASIDSPTITNDSLAINIRDISVDVQQRVYSRDYKGNTVENPYLFSRNDTGEITGYTTLSGTSREFATGDEVISNWNVRVGTTSQSIASVARLSYESPVLNARAGDANYGIFIDVTSGSLTSSWQGEVPISPWRAALGDIALDETIVSGRLTVTRNGQPADSPQAIIKVEGGVNRVVRTWNLSDLLASGLAQQLDQGLVWFRVPARLFAGGDYSVSVQLSDGNGITAQDVLQFATITPQTPVSPVIPGAPDDSGTISPETPGDTSSRPEPAQPTPPRDGAYEQDQQGLLTQILKSKETPIRVAQSMLGVLIAIVVVLAYQMYREWRHARFLLAVIRRDTETIANKDAFLQLASHHLRTPLTLLSSSSDLLAMNPSEAVKQLNQQLSGVVAGLKAKAEDILARTNTSEAVTLIASTPDEKAARRNVYRSPVFWAPVILTVVLTVAANWAVQTFGGQTIATSTIVSQVALLLLGGILLYTAARMLTQRRQRSKALEQSRAKTHALNRAKVAFARQVGQELTDDILHTTAYIQQLSPMTDVTTQGLLKEGVERLERLVSRFTVLNNVYANTTQQSVVDVKKTVDEALRTAQQQNPAVAVSMEDYVKPITTRHSSWMVTRLLQDVFTSMAPLAGSGVIKVDSRQTKDATTLTITGPSSHDAPAEDLFSVYSRADEESAGTFSIEAEDNRMHRLDLYLDRMIADELEAELSAKRVGDKMQVTVELPNAA